jgi:hypothetical protein
VYRSQHRSTYLCTDSTDLLSASVSVLAVNYDPLGSLAHRPTILDYRVFPYSFCVRELFPYSVALAGWVSFIIHSRVSYCYYNINRPGYVAFDTASLPEDACVVLTVQWVANPLAPIRYTVYRTVCCYSRTKDRGMISSIHLFCSIHIFRRSFFY